MEVNPQRERLWKLGFAYANCNVRLRALPASRRPLGVPFLPFPAQRVMVTCWCLCPGLLPSCQGKSRAEHCVKRASSTQPRQNCALQPCRLPLCPVCWGFWPTADWYLLRTLLSTAVGSLLLSWPLQCKSCPQRIYRASSYIQNCKSLNDLKCKRIKVWKTPWSCGR